MEKGGKAVDKKESVKGGFGDWKWPNRIWEGISSKIPRSEGPDLIAIWWKEAKTRMTFGDKFGGKTKESIGWMATLREGMDDLVIHSYCKMINAK